MNQQNIFTIVLPFEKANISILCEFKTPIIYYFQLEKNRRQCYHYFHKLIKSKIIIKNLILLEWKHEDCIDQLANTSNESIRLLF